MSTEVDRHLWLVGMMGSGKTAVAAELASRWNADVIDTDDEVSSRTGCSIAQLWGERGERAFREMESATVRRLAEGPPAVIATGGGAVLDEENVTAMRGSGKVVWLNAAPETLSARVGDGSGRPLLDVDASAGTLRQILDDRRHRYEAAADLTLDTTHDEVVETADRIEAWWNAF